MRGSQRHHAVATEAKPVHPVGQPISASTNSGFSVGVSPPPVPPAVIVSGAGRESPLTACSFKGRLLRAIVSDPASPLRQSRADGVAQQRTRPASCLRQALGRLPPAFAGAGLLAFTVGQTASEDEQPFAAVGSADFRRREQSFRNDETQDFQLFPDLAIAEVEMIGDVLQENRSWLALVDDARDMGPEMAGIVGAAPPPSDAERLARIARKHEVHRATPWAAVKAGKVVPDRCRIQGRVRHPRHEDGRGVGVPFDITHSTVSGFGDVQAKVETAGPGAQRQPEQGAAASSAGGRYSHVMYRHPFRWETASHPRARPVAP